MSLQFAARNTVSTTSESAQSCPRPDMQSGRGIVNFNLWVINADGTQPKQLTHTRGCTRNLDPAWSPDGRKIAFDSDRDFPSDNCSNPELGIRQVFVMDADGTDQSSLTSLPGKSGSPAWGWTDFDANRLGNCPVE